MRDATQLRRAMWRVHYLLDIRFAFMPPLSPPARRAGYAACDAARVIFRCMMMRAAALMMLLAGASARVFASGCYDGGAAPRHRLLDAMRRAERHAYTRARATPAADDAFFASASFCACLLMACLAPPRHAARRRSMPRAA